MREIGTELTPLRIYAATGVLATALAVHRSEPARPFAIGFPGPVAAQAVIVGTGLSAPAPMLPLAWQTRSPALKGLLAGMFLAGALAEPVTWRTLRHPLRNPLVTAVVVANITLPAIHLVALARQSRNGPPAEADAA